MARKKIQIVIFSVAVAILVSFLFATYIPIKLKGKTPKNSETVDYPGFGIWIPPDYEVHGIDVSRHQQKINWDEVASHKHKDVEVSFAFIKASEGVTIKDPLFSTNWKDAKSANILRGAYHFFRPHLTAEQQFALFKSVVKLEKEDLPPVLDVEIRGSGSPARLKSGVKKWLKLAEKYYGVTPILYTNYSFYKHYFNTPEFKKYPLWIAHYATDDLNKLTSNWHFWQHNESARVKGIRGTVDFNVYKGKYDELLELCKK
ncbi:MAG: glycoside hydrolase family 25 protein [Bacteroidia bacterium]